MFRINKQSPDKDFPVRALFVDSKKRDFEKKNQISEIFPPSNLKSDTFSCVLDFFYITML